jgi:hypothetical protein
LRAAVRVFVLGLAVFFVAPLLLYLVVFALKSLQALWLEVLRGHFVAAGVFVLGFGNHRVHFALCVVLNHQFAFDLR